jgi:2-phospho-L-lactate guanylyltransferase
VIVAAVPVKDLASAKQRLAAALSPARRAALARAMLHDVLGALVAARLDAVWVVTADPAAAALARAAGAEPIREAGARGHTAAVALAQARAVALGARTFITVPADAPLLTVDEVRALAAAAAAGPAAAFAPSRSGLGTNGVALNPPAAVALRFGEPSFARHLAAARAAGIEPRVLELRGLGLDIDDAADLAALAREGRHTASGRLLAAWRAA